MDLIKTLTPPPRPTPSAASVLEEDDGVEEAFRWSKLSSSLDVRWTDAFVVVGLEDATDDVSFRDRIVVAAREKRSRVVGDGGNADGANDDTRNAMNATNDDTTTMERRCTMLRIFLPLRPSLRIGLRWDMVR